MEIHQPLVLGKKIFKFITLMIAKFLKVNPYIVWLHFTDIFFYIMLDIIYLYYIFILYIGISLDRLHFKQIYKLM
jgi:hypothetical protein